MHIMRVHSNLRLQIERVRLFANATAAFFVENQATGTYEKEEKRSNSSTLERTKWKRAIDLMSVIIIIGIKRGNQRKSELKLEALRLIVFEAIGRVIYLPNDTKHQFNFISMKN